MRTVCLFLIFVHMRLLIGGPLAEALRVKFDAVQCGSDGRVRHHSTDVFSHDFHLSPRAVEYLG